MGLSYKGRYEETGDVVAHKQPNRPDKRKLDNLHELYIIGLVHENPALYLQEICAKIFEATCVSITGSTVCKVLHKNGLTKKEAGQSSTSAINRVQRGVYG